MPELPEVETIVRDLKLVQEKTFSAIKVQDPFVLRQPASDFIHALKKQRIKKILRRGKAIVVELSSGKFLVIQVMMTGQLVINAHPDKHTRIIFSFSDGSSLLYNDQRRFGQLRVVKDLGEINYFNILGHEPFSKEFTPEYLYEVCQRSQRPIKNFLLDHTVVAGIGNIYACEILFRSGVSPKRPVSKIKKAETLIIHQQIKAVLDEAIKYRGSSMRNYRDGAGQKGKFNQLLSVYAKEGELCQQCHEPIVRMVQAGRSTFYCQRCQK